MDAAAIFALLLSPLTIDSTGIVKSGNFMASATTASAGTLSVQIASYIA